MRTINTEYYGDDTRWFIGVIRSIDDPDRLGREGKSLAVPWHKFTDGAGGQAAVGTGFNEPCGQCPRCDG